MSTVSNIVRGGQKYRPAAGTDQTSASDLKVLVQQAAGGNFQAFGSLYSIYLDRIFRYVYYQVNDRMTAEDITEEVFVKAWKAMRSCRGKEDTFQSWLYRIAHNHMVDYLRDSGRVTSLEKDSQADVPDPYERIESGIEYMELLNAIASLPDTQRQVIVLKFIEGLDNREAGRVLGKNEGAIRIAQMRALASLRDKLGETRHEDGKQAVCKAG
jgi:RNA polymerase sigma-70 factor (ECF subfamily)